MLRYDSVNLFRTVIMVDLLTSTHFALLTPFKWHGLSILIRVFLIMKALSLSDNLRGTFANIRKNRPVQ